MSPEQRVENAYSKHPDLRVAVVSVTESRHLTSPVKGMEQTLRRLDTRYEAPWRATAAVKKIIVGQGSPELLVFDRGWGAAACDDGTTMPRRGDKWVVYYTSSSSTGTANVLESYPLATASRIDATLRDYVR